MTPVKGEVVDEDPQVAVDLARTAEQKVYAALASGKEAAWGLAEALYDFDEVSGWRRLGHESLEEWLAQPEVGLKKTLYYNLVSSWRSFVVHREIEPSKLRGLEPSKVAIVAKRVAKAQVTVEEATSDVETLGFRDLREKYGKPRAEPEPKEPDTKSESTSGRKDSVRTDEPVEAGPKAMTIAQATELAAKRFHREPDEAKVTEHLQAMGVSLVPDIPWEDLERAVAGGGPNPRIPATVLQTIIDWKG